MGNLYLVPNNKNKTGGDFYNIYHNTGEKLNLLDIDNITDPTLKCIGGIILQRGQTIDNVTTYRADENGVLLEVTEFNEMLTTLTNCQESLNKIKEKIITRSK